MLMLSALHKILSESFIYFTQAGYPVSGFFGNTPFHFTLYAAIIIAITWFIIRSQTISLFKTKRLLKEKEQAIAQIENQRAELEQKNKSITDSLIYAQRIQEALLPSETYIRKYFPRSFILYKPRDIVSGDFYWIGDRGDKRFIVAADCTGHGVPGALMSMIGHDLIEKVINDENSDNTGKILDSMNKSLAETFNREKNAGTVIRDGMDIGICSVDIKRMKLEFSGAFFPLYLIRDDRLIEIKGDKFTLGMAPDGITFSNTEMDLMKDDMLYLFSDGYADQFGGEENKKFMFRRFRYLLLTINRFPIEDQKSILEENMSTWQGDNAQVDDILIIGFKPL